MKTFDVIVTCDNIYGIYKNGTIPWRIMNEMNFFVHLINKTDFPHQINAVVMDDSIYCNAFYQFKNVIKIVVSNEPEIKSNDTNFVKTLDEALEFTSKNSDIDNVYIVGGSDLYEIALKHQCLKGIYQIMIDHNYDCDKFFPMIDYRFKKILGKNDRDLDIKSNCMVNLKYSKYEVIKPYHELMIKDGEYQYLDALRYLLKYAEHRETRNSKTFSMFGYSMYFNLDRFPLLTTKQVFFRGVFEELKFFLQGKSDTKILSKKGVTIWEPNTSEEFIQKCNLKYRSGDMGNMYGVQLRAFGCDYKGCDINYIGTGIDQIKNSLDLLVRDPNSRRNLLTTYDPSKVHQGVLYPCHGIIIQLYLDQDNYLSCCMYQRSADIICGVPFNIASYALLVHIYCEILNGMTGKDQYKPGRLIINFGDLHLYDREDHIACAKIQLSREPYQFCKLRIKKSLKSIECIDNLEFSDLELVDYKTHSSIKVEMVV